MIWGFILTTGLPTGFVLFESIPAAAQAPPSKAVLNADAAAQAPDSTGSSAVSRALATGDRSAPGQVRKTSGGLFGVLGLGDTGGSKEKDDGRKAYPLPPPDPSTVNWNGVPYHKGKQGIPVANNSGSPQPIRDAGGSASVARSPQKPAPSPSPSQTAAAPSGIRRVPVANSGNPRIPTPPPPLDESQPTTIASRTLESTPTTGVTNSRATLSQNTSSRRTGRKEIEPLSPTPGNVPKSEPAEPTKVAAAPNSKPRIPVPPPPLPVSERIADTSGPTPASQPKTTATPKSPAPTQVAANPPRPSVPSVPPSLQDLPESEPIASPDESVAAVPVPLTPAQNASLTKVPVDKTIASPAAPSDAPSLTMPQLDSADAPSPESIAAAPTPTTDSPGAPAGQRDTTDQDAAMELGSPSNAGLANAGLANAEPSDLAAADPITGTAVPLAADDTTSDPTPESAQADQPLGSGLISEQIASRPVSRPPGVIASPSNLGQVLDASQPRAQSLKQLAVSESPGIRVVTEGPSEILLRQEIQYEVRVENRGPADASGIVVRTTLPPWAEVKGHNASSGNIEPLGVGSEKELQWKVDSLKAGASERLSIRVQASKAGKFDVATRWTMTPQDQVAAVTVREPKLAVQIEGPDEIVFGKSQRYRIRVLNPGDGTASNVVFTLKPENAAPVDQKLGQIPAGKESSFEIELTARDRGKLAINGDVKGDLDLTAVAAKSVSVIAADLEASLSGQPLYFQNTEAQFGLDLVNSGRVASESVQAELRIPDGMKYLGGISGARVVDGNKLLWTIPSIPPGESRPYSFKCRVEKTGTHRLAFACKGSAGGNADVQLDTNVEAIVDLKLAVQDPPAPAPVGSEVVYELVIHNHGSMAAENVRVVGQFGNGIEPLRTEGQTGEVTTGQVQFAPIPRIEPGAQAKLKIVAKADAAGDHRFRAEVHSGETVLVAEEATIFVDMSRQRVSRSSTAPVGIQAPR
jgi:hypothetical protein